MAGKQGRHLGHRTAPWRWGMVLPRAGLRTCQQATACGGEHGCPWWRVGWWWCSRAWQGRLPECTPIGLSNSAPAPPLSHCAGHRRRPAARCPRGSPRGGHAGQAVRDVLWERHHSGRRYSPRPDARCMSLPRPIMSQLPRLSTLNPRRSAMPPSGVRDHAQFRARRTWPLLARDSRANPSLLCWCSVQGFPRDYGWVQQGELFPFVNYLEQMEVRARARALCDSATRDVSSACPPANGSPHVFICPHVPGDGPPDVCTAGIVPTMGADGHAAAATGARSAMALLALPA